MEIRPDYRNSVYNVPHTVLESMGMKTGKGLNSIDIANDSVLLFIVDALGANIVKNMKRYRPQTVLTSVFPSTTSAAITTVFTGKSPKEHGILEWYMFYEEFGDIIKSIPFTLPESSVTDLLIDMGYSPKPLFEMETVFQRISGEGMKSSSYLPEEYINSAYSQFMLRGSSVHGYDRIEDLPKMIEKDNADYIYIYTDIVDQTQHAYGVESEATTFAVRMIESVIKGIEEKMGDRSMIVTADHGQTSIYEKEVKSFGNCPVGGSPRDVFLYCTDPVVENYNVIGREEIVNLLGPGKPNPALKYRMPEYIILPGDHMALWGSEFEVKGMHGGLSRDEMLVPLILVEK